MDDTLTKEELDEAIECLVEITRARLAGARRDTAWLRRQVAEAMALTFGPDRYVEGRPAARRLAELLEKAERRIRARRSGPAAA